MQELRSLLSEGLHLTRSVRHLNCVVAKLITRLLQAAHGELAGIGLHSGDAVVEPAHTRVAFVDLSAKALHCTLSFPQFRD
ncbi:hypothetical protein, partial [Lentibacter algarum]|uniref:hypothetical protein n=1 Tax=Lentibacter algarum TaxID=576131 RepID=UPI0026F07920